MHRQAGNWPCLHGQVPQLEAHEVTRQHVAPAGAEAQAAGGGNDLGEPVTLILHI